MNKIYRTVYNETTGTWVAVCETAKTHTKSSGKSSVVKAVAAVSMAAVAGVAMAGSVVATNTEPVSVTGSDSTTAQRLKLEAMVAAFNSLGGTLTENADGSYSHNGTLVINADGTLTAIGQTRIPHKVKTDALSQLAVGDNAHSNKGGAVAVGSNAYAGGYQSVAVGMGASANGGGAVAIGGGLSNGTLQGAVANGNGAISLGVNALAQGDNAFAAAGGHAQSNNTISIGVRSIADGEGAIAFGSGINQGNNAGSYAKGEGSIAIGKRAEAVRATVQYDGEKGNYTLPQNVTTDPHGHQYTYNRTVIQDNGSGAQIIAIGDNASAYGNQSIALGGNSVATGYASVAIGGDDIGSATNNREIINYLTNTLANELNAGGFDTPTAITNLSNGQYYVNLTTSKGDVSTAFGIKAVSEGNLSNAYGVAARSVGLNSNAFGTTSFAGGDESIAFGTASKTAIGADKATAVGYMSQIGENGDNSVALGAKNKVTQANSAAIGQNNTVVAENTFVLGNNVGQNQDKTIANSVYLGAGSTTKAQGGAAVTDFVNSATVGGITYGGFKGQTVQLDQNGEAVLDAQGNTQVVGGIVSVGSAGQERRIKNVAAGRIGPNSTDAINGSQLYAVLPKYTTVGGDGADKDNAKSVTIGDKTYNFANYTAGDNITIDENGKISATGGSGENNWNLTVNDESSSATAPNAKRNLKDSDNIVINQTTDASDPTKADISFDLANVVTIGTPASKDPASGDKPVVIDGSANGGSITFTNADGTASNQGVINGVASHLQDPASKDGQGKEINSANAPANFNSVKNEAATVGDVLNAGWNLQVADDNGNLQAADFVQHGDTVKFGDSTTIDAQYDAKDGVIKFNANTATLENDGGKVKQVADGDTNKLVTAGNLQTVINNTYWTAKDGSGAGTQVSPNGSVTFKGADKGNISVTNNGGVFEFKVNTAGNAPTVTNITSTPADDASEILTAGQVTQTINEVAENWQWKIQGRDDGVNQNGGKAAEVKYDNTVNINAGKGLSLTQNGTTLNLENSMQISSSDSSVTATQDADGNWDLKATGNGGGENNWDLTVNDDNSTETKPNAKRNLKDSGNIVINQTPNASNADNADISFDLADKITVGDTVSGSPVVIDGTANGGTITFTDNKGNVSNQGVIDGVASHFDNVGNSTTMPTNNAPANFAKQTNQAATLGDVLNAGWGLKANGSAVDFVAHGDTVDFTSNDQSIIITPKVTDGKDSVLDLSANVTFYADEAATQEAQATDKAKSVKVGNKTYQLGGDTYNVTGPNTPVTVVGTGSVKVEDTSGNGAEYTVSIPVVANSGGNAATAANVANSSTGSVAMGENAKIDNNVADSIAIGKDASVGNLGTGNVVIGAGSSTPNRAENMVVIGTGLNITQGTPNAVVIGSGSAASSAVDSDLNPNKFTFRSTSLNKANEGSVNDGAKATVATFNVGAEQGQLRQIKGVAAGRTEKGSTDAVNGDQLYTVALAVDNMGYSLAGGGTVDAQGNITGGTGVLGESFTVNTDDAYGKIGTIIGKNIAGTGEDTIEDAIKATKTIVEKESGSPITVTSNTNGDKSTTYTVGIETTTPETVITDPTDSNVGKVVITAGDENKIVTAGDLATAINSSGWVASDSSNNAFVATGDTVTIKGKNGVKVGLDAAKQTFTVESDYVFKDKDGNDVTNAGGDVTAIETKDDAGNTVTYNIGGGDGNDITSLTAQGESANSTTGNLKLTDSGTGDSHQYDIALNNTVELGDSTTDGSLTVGNQAGDSKTEINPNNINFTNADGGSITNVASHLQDPASKDDKGQVINPANTPDNFNSVKNEAATVGDVLNAGWNLKVGDTDADFVQHGDTVAFGNGKGTTAQYDATNGVVSFDIDYVFKDGSGNDITNTGGDVATITTKDDKGNDVTYNFGDGNDNTVTAITVNGGQDAATNKADGGNLTLTETKDADGNPTYDIALNNNVELGDDKGNSGSLNVNNGTGGSTNIEGNKITFGDTTTPNSGSIDGLAQHFTKTGDTTAPSVATGTTDDQAATVGDVKNVGWNLKVGGQAKDFINHGDTVNFGNGKGTTAQFVKDATTGETTISFDIAKAGDSKVDTTVTNADAGKVTGGTGDEYWDSNQVQNAINNAGWKAGTGATANAKDELINAGDRVGLVAGQGVKVTQDGSNFTFATDYVFKDGQGDDITNKGGDVATITTKDDKGNDVTYNFGDGNDNTVTGVTVNGGQDATTNAADGGNLKLEEKTDANGNPTYDIALNDEVDLTDKGSLKVGGDDIANGSPVTNITAGNIDFGDTQGSITNVASHLKDPASKDDKGQVINPDNAPANFNSVKNEAATVGDVLNAGWNLKVGGQDADFVQHGDTVAFGNSDTVSAAYDSGVIKFNANTTPLTVNNSTGVVNAPANNNALVTAGDVQTAINNAGWFVSSQGRAGAANPVLVNAGNEVKFIAGDGMDIVQNGKELTFNAKIVDTNGNQLKLDQDGNYVVGIVDPSGNPVTVNSDGEFVVGGGSSSGGGRPFVITADDGTGNQSTTTIDGVAKTEGSGVTFVGDENVKVIKQPTQGGDGTDVVVGLQNVVNVGGTSDGTSGGQPNAGAVQIDGTKGGNSIAISTDGKGNLKVGDSNKNNAAPIKITNVKAGENRTDAVNVGQLVDTVGASSTTNVDKNGNPITDENGNQIDIVKTTGSNGEEYTLKTYNVKDQGEYLTNNVVEAVSKMNEQGIKFFHTNEDENFVPVAQDHNPVDSSASGGLSTAIGVNSKATGKQSISVGNESEANGVQSIAVGTQVVVNGDHSGGIGDPTIIDGSNSYSVGNSNIVATDNTFVLGNNVTKTAENSVFLGNFAGTDVAGAGATGTVDKAELKDKSGNVVATYGGFAGETANGLVSVGGTDDKGQVVVRRVSGVAAGEISATSTDAINGSQLYAVLPDYVGSDGINVVMDDNGAGRKKVTISTVPGYAEGIEAGNNVVFNYKPVYETDAGGVTTDPDKAKKDANGDPVAKMITDKNGNQVQQQTTVINAKQPDLTPVNNRIDQVQNQVQQVENNAYAGVAQAMATAGLPQAYLPGKSMVAIAGGHYKGEQGYAVGVSSISDSGNWVFKATASGNTRGNVGGTIGAGYQW